MDYCRRCDNDIMRVEYDVKIDSTHRGDKVICDNCGEWYYAREYYINEDGDWYFNVTGGCRF